MDEPFDFGTQMAQTASTSYAVSMQNSPQISPRFRSAACSPSRSGVPNRSPLRGASSLDALHQTPTPSLVQLPTSSMSNSRDLRSDLLRKNQKTTDWLFDHHLNPTATSACSSKAGSVLSCQSGMTEMSGLSNISGISALTIQTDLPKDDFTALNHFMQQRQVQVQENIAPYPEPLDESGAREMQIRREFWQDPPRFLHEVDEHYYDPTFESYRHPLIRQMSIAAAEWERTVCHLPPFRDPSLDPSFNLVERIARKLFTDLDSEMSRMEALQSLHALLKVNYWRQSVAVVFREDASLSRISTRIFKDSIYAPISIHILHYLQFDRNCRHQSRSQLVIKRLLDFIFHDTNLSPKLRFVAISCLKRILNGGRKYADDFVKLSGISNFLLFLDRRYDFIDSSGDQPTPLASCNFMRVERTEELLQGVTNSLCAVIGFPEFAEKFVEADGMEIVSGWLDHGSTRFNLRIVHALLTAAHANAAQTRILNETIRRVVQFLGTDDMIMSSMLVSVLLWLLRCSQPQHVQTVADAGAISELTRLAAKVAEMRMICGKDEAQLRAVAGPIYAIQLQLPVQKGKEPIFRLVVRPGEPFHSIPRERLLEAVDELLVEMIRQSLYVISALCFHGSHQNMPNHLQQRMVSMLSSCPDSVPLLFRTATFDFAYASVPPDKHPAYFVSLREGRKIKELASKQDSFKLLHYLRISGVDLTKVTDPLHGESLTTMLWRHIYDVFNIIRTQPLPQKVREELRAFGVAALNFQLSLFSSDPEHLRDTCRLLCVENRLGMQRGARLNPIRMLIRFSIDSQEEFHLMVELLRHLDCFLTILADSAEAGFWWPPLRSWLQPPPDSEDHKHHIPERLGEALSQAFQLILHSIGVNGHAAPSWVVALHAKLSHYQATLAHPSPTTLPSPSPGFQLPMYHHQVPM